MVFLECVDCGMREREEWALKGNHICHTITDQKFLITKDMLLKIGKRRWVNIKCDDKRW